ncbi:MAG: copper homeostasis protein CutC [Gemmatimonadales bacterium]|jgi:copper homeostasis protein|nr:copper homeostasis protein CutC [Gemmatimonadales bacterium]
MENRVLVEACVESVESAVAAAEGGADRIELCDALVEGGTTPSAGSIRLARARLGIGICVMIRPRGGDFLYTDLEFEVMRDDVAVAKRLGADGVVLGLLLPDGTIDRARTARLVEDALPLPVTFHRAFDVSRDPLESLETLIDLGVHRVLTSGQRASAMESLDLISHLVDTAGNRITILAGGGITADNAARIVAATGVSEIHLYAPRRFPSPMAYRNETVPMGMAYRPEEYVRTVVDPVQIRAVVESVRRT